MKNNRKALLFLLIVCLLIFLSISRNHRKPEKKDEPESSSRLCTELML